MLCKSSVFEFISLFTTSALLHQNFPLSCHSHLSLPRLQSSVPLPHMVSPATFEQVMRAGFSQKAQACGAKRLIARDRALLWVLFDTGITVTELCALRVADLDLKTGLLHVRGKGGRERQLTLGPTCLSHLRSYLRQMDPTTRRGLARREAGGDPLFSTQRKQPLTRNGVTMVCARFRKRAGIRETTFSLQVLRHTICVAELSARKHDTIDPSRNGKGNRKREHLMKLNTHASCAFWISTCSLPLIGQRFLFQVFWTAMNVHLRLSRLMYATSPRQIPRCEAMRPGLSKTFRTI